MDVWIPVLLAYCSVICRSLVFFLDFFCLERFFRIYCRVYSFHSFLFWCSHQLEQKFCNLRLIDPQRFMQEFQSVRNPLPQKMKCTSIFTCKMSCTSHKILGGIYTCTLKSRTVVQIAWPVNANVLRGGWLGVLDTTETPKTHAAVAGVAQL